MPKYDTWSLERIGKALDDARLDDELARRASKARILDLQAAYERKAAEAGLSPAMRDAMAQALSPDGIASGGSFGKLGGGKG